MTKGLVRANNLADLSSKQDSIVNLGLAIADYDALRSLYATAGLDFSVIGGIAGSTGNYQAQVDGISSTLSGIVLSGFVNRQGNGSISTSWANSDGIISISGVLSGYSPSSGTTFALSIEQGEAVITTSGLSANDLAYNSFRQANSTVVRASPPSGFNTLQLIPLQVGGQSFFVQASETPSFHIAPARMRHALDLVTGNLLGTYNSASPAWAVGPDGVLALPAADAPVIEYDAATLQCLGARIWGAVTNQIRNNTGVGAVAGTPGTAPTNWSMPPGGNGLSRQIVGIGQSGGIDYIDVRYFGTATVNGQVIIQPEGNTAVTAASGQSWTASSYLLVVGGSASGIPIQQRISGRSSAGSFLESAVLTTTSAVSLATARFSASMTFANASTARVTNDIILGYTAGAAIDITLRIGLPQLEQSATMGAVVKTTTLAASSTADVWDITSLTAGINNLKTLYFRGRTAASGTRGIASMNDNTANNRLELSTSGTTAKATAITSGSTVADLSGGTIAANTTFRLAVRLDTDSYALSLNGGAVVTDTSGARALVDRLFIGRDQAGNYMNGYLEEIAGWTRACTDAQVTALAAS